MTRHNRRANRDRNLVRLGKLNLAALIVELAESDPCPELCDALYDSTELCLSRATATNDTKDTLKKLHATRGAVEQVLKAEKVAQAWARHMAGHPLCKLDGPHLRLIKGKGN